MNTYEFWNQSTEETIEVEAEGFEEASNIVIVNTIPRIGVF